ncbi:DUF7576 family protein [Halorubrum sp. DTA46]|uniref:DUF7576 family protein n=1 Tax=Halorubrum sp. DTA46 TaxID=3402162 RepID=UPI003AB02EBB
MVDPTSDLEEDVDEESAPRCDACGKPAFGAGRRIVTWIDGDEMHKRHFCTQACRDEWTGERPRAGD